MFYIWKILHNFHLFHFQPCDWMIKNILMIKNNFSQIHDYSKQNLFSRTKEDGR